MLAQRSVVIYAEEYREIRISKMRPFAFFQHADITRDEVKRQPLKYLLRLFLWGVGIALLFNSLILVNFLFFPSRAPDMLSAGVHIEAILGQFIGIFFCWRGLPEAWQKRTTSEPLSAVQIAQRWMPLWVGLAFFANALGDSIYAYLEIHHIHLAVKWPDAVYLGHYLFLLLAILCLPRRLLSSSARVRVVLDGFMIITALITFSWYFLLGPVVLQGGTTLFVKIVVVSHLLGDIMLSYCLLQFSWRISEPGLRIPGRLLLFGLACLVITNGISEYQVVQPTTMLDPWSALFDCLGYIFISLAAISVYTLDGKRDIPADGVRTRAALPIPPLWQMLLPYVFVPAVIVLMITIWYTVRQGVLAEGVYLGGMILIVQVILRQVLVLCETYFNNLKLQYMQRELHSNNQALSEANRRLEEQARELSIAYQRQRQANELKDQFLLNVNHELRTPLTELHGYLELLHLHRDSLDAELQSTFLSHALHGSEELQRMVNTVLNALETRSAEEMLHWEELSVSSVVQGAIDLFEPQKRQSYLLHLVISTTLTVRADRQYLHQVLCNLLSNAFKYAPPQTAIEIGACHTQHTDTQYTDAPSHVLFWIKDNGPGIPPEDIPLLFEKFVRLKRDQVGSVRGTGLGLFISKQLVEAMGGRIWVESSGVSGEGSCFYFTLPAIQSTDQSQQASRLTKSNYAARND